jgi:hypothetical protein
MSKDKNTFGLFLALKDGYFDNSLRTKGEYFNAPLDYHGKRFDKVASWVKLEREYPNEEFAKKEVQKKQQASESVDDDVVKINY